MTFSTKRRFLIAALSAPLLLGACGTAPSAAPAPTSAATSAVAEIQAGEDFNETDVMFLQMMVHHQKQGIQMTSTAIKRSTNADLKTLAQAVQATEKDELAMMQSWLKGWNKPVDVDTHASLHADHGGLPGTGAKEIKALTTVAKAKFDSAFLNLFLAHQHNAMEMANMPTAQGKNEETKKFAERVKQSRQGEIQQMLKLMNA